MSRVEWTPDSLATACSSKTCNRLFGVFVRRHHCRACGRVYCASCTSKRRYLAGFDNAERVCDECAAGLDAEEERRRGAAVAMTAATLCLASVAAGEQNDRTLPRTLCTLCYGRSVQYHCQRCGLRVCDVCCKGHEEACAREGDGFRVRVTVHEARSVGTHGITRPCLSVAVCTANESMRTNTVPSSCSPYFGEEFSLRIPDCTASIFFQVVHDGLLSQEVVGRAAVPLPTLHPRTHSVERVWLELLPHDASKPLVYRSATRPNPMKRPRTPLGWLCVSVAAGQGFDVLRFFHGPAVTPSASSPQLPDDFSAQEFLLHVHRLQPLLEPRMPPVLAAVQEATEVVKLGVLLPMWGALCLSCCLHHVPFVFAVLLLLNGALTGRRGRGAVPVFEDEGPTAAPEAGVGARLRSAVQAAAELPHVLRRLQAALQAAASFVERLDNVFSFLDPAISVASAALLFATAAALSAVLYTVPVSLLVFLAGVRAMFPLPDTSPGVLHATGIPTFLRTAADRVADIYCNLYRHIPDTLEIEHRAIALWQRCGEEPSVVVQQAKWSNPQITLP